MKIAMLVLNNLEYDSRVKKEAASLIQAGHDLLVFSAQKRVKGVSERTAIHFDGVDIPVQPMEIRFTMLERAFDGIASGSKKVLILFLWPFGVFSQQRQQSEKGKHPLLAYLAKTPIYALRSAIRFLANTFTVFLPTSWVLSGWRTEVVKWSPDVVHCHDLETCSVGLEVLGHIDCGIVYDSHELWTERTRREVRFLGYFVKRAEKSLESKVLDACSGAIVVSPDFADYLSKLHSSERKKFSVIRNKPILSPLLTSAPCPGQKARLGPGSVIYPGRITRKRALENLLEAAAMAGQENKKIFLMGYGDEKYIKSLFEMANRLGVSLTHLPPVKSEQVPLALASAEVVFVGVERASISYDFALPNKYFEALASGRPVVYPRLTSMARDAKQFRSCLPYDDGNIGSLASALDAAARLEVTRHEAQERRMAADWRNEGQALGDLYEKFES